ncbi:MAG TPA: septal ring lytic transglycosylase RlpA family protein [Candidatus Binataceae bacterium]|nr:septal ring lytic transglycosylase RlpA family protein [Candidatus Binataceae bacterium]
MAGTGGYEKRKWFFKIAAAAAIAATLAGCATRQVLQPAAPPPVVAAPAPAAAPPQYAKASWYGPGFNGRRTSSGEIYNENDLTAASTMYPLGSRVMVTNLDNERSVEVTINDRGPNIRGRKIDLSHKAASVIGMLKAGTAHVRIDLLSAPPGSRPVGTPLRYYVQVGSFASLAPARELRSKLHEFYRDVRIEPVAAAHQHYYRVQMGAFASRSAAEARAAQTAKLGYPIVIVSE